MRRLLTMSLVMGGLVLTGCAAPPLPEVTFFADGTTIRVGPAQFCREGAEQCDGYPEARGRLPVPGGKPLSISVPAQVAEAPWIVVFRYRSVNGTEQQGRTSLFRAGSQYAYTLTPPAGGDQLLDVEVQRITNIAADANNELAFVSDATWVLEIPS